MRKIFIPIVVLIMIASCKSDHRLFKKLDKKDSGINFENQITETDDFNILDYLYFYNGGGVAIGDINNDGLPDIYLSGNQKSNKLYLNKGGLKFEDITEQAGVAGKSDWNTGAVMGDVNGDGLLDIYVCALVGLRGLNGHNELFINNGDNTFSEKSANYNLDYDTYSSTASFLDYDLDGDLDIFLLNHAVHTQESFGHAKLRFKKSYESGDRLLRNDGGKFVDVSDSAGIYGGVNGYGLGISVADFNQDTYPDIYIGNDFHEDDYYYLNNGDGTFTESLKEYFGHTSRFSMGNDAADINHDGLPDLISLDMLPADEKVLKSSDGDDPVNIMRIRTQQYGYHYQYSRNMLQVNTGGNQFEETALLSGVSATDWSWSALFADYNQDGIQDLFISNGIPRRPNDLDYIKFVSNDQVKNKIDETKLVDQQALELMPSGAVSNYVYKGNGDLSFEDMSKDWLADEALFSTATAMGDLDNDGDIDLVINNLNSSAQILINQTNESASYLKVKFAYKLPNKYGVGTKVYAYQGGKLQYKELYPVRGFQSSSEPIIHLGFGKETKLDSLIVNWPDRTSQIMYDIALNQTISIAPKKLINRPFRIQRIKNEKIFELTKSNLGINFEHKEDRYIDFDRQKLIPYQVSDRGPATSVGDINMDGKMDVFFGGSKYKSSKWYIQSDSSFIQAKYPTIQMDSVNEEVVATIADFDSNGKNDLLIGTGGADFFNQMTPLKDRYFRQNNDGFALSSLPDAFENTSVIATCDYDQDGDLDIFMGGQAVSNDFGKIPTSRLLKNENGQFSVVENASLQNVGMVTDAIWDDYNQDGFTDLIVVGEWMSPQFFKNSRGVLEKEDVLTKKLNGLWQSVAPFDVDSDGDTDYLLGNWGKNSKFLASDASPLKMYYADFDKNKSTETIIATATEGKYYPLEGLDELVGQLVYLRKKYTSYQSFAGQTIEEIFDEKALKKAQVLEVNNLLSGYLKNENGKYKFVAFPNELQLAPVMDILVYDFDGDEKEEALLGGNYFGVKPYHGRFDSFSGALLKNETTFLKGNDIGLSLVGKSLRSLNVIEVRNKSYILVTFNNDRAQLYSLPKK